MLFMTGGGRAPSEDRLLWWLLGSGLLLVAIVAFDRGRIDRWLAAARALSLALVACWLPTRLGSPGG